MRDITIKVFSRQEVQEFVTDMPHLFISLYDPDLTPVDVPNNPYLIDRIDIDCWDIDQEDQNFPIKIFTADDARMILSLVNTKLHNINLIVVSCEAGISRSAGVASSLTKILGKTDETYFTPKGRYRPNRHIYRTILNTAVEMGLYGN